MIKTSKLYLKCKAATFLVSYVM